MRFFAPRMIFILGTIGFGCLAILSGEFLLGIVMFICAIILAAITV
jgi:hypothetical protein